MGKSPRKLTTGQGCVIHRRGGGRLEDALTVPIGTRYGDRGGEKDQSLVHNTNTFETCLLIKKST
jgi:hypothetical protein